MMFFLRQIILLILVSVAYFSDLPTKAFATDRSMQEPTAPNFTKLRNQTADLSEQANELMKLIRPLTGVIYVITFDDMKLKPTKLTHLSATILKDGRILTAFHVLNPLLKALEKEQSKNKRFLLFFIPGSHVYDFREDAYDFGERKIEPISTLKVNNEFWDKVPRLIVSSSTPLEPRIQTIDKGNINLEKFLNEIHDILKEANEHREEHHRTNHLLSITQDYGRVQLANDEEIGSFAKRKNMYLIKTIINPQYDKHHKHHDIHSLPHTLKVIDERNDIAVCDLTNAELLPKSFLNLVKFNNQNIMNIKNQEHERNIFISSAYDKYYFFIGGSPQKSTSNMQITSIDTFKVPLPQMGGCSGGSLICAPKVNNKYDVQNVIIIGVVSSGAKPENTDEVECCPWTE